MTKKLHRRKGPWYVIAGFSKYVKGPYVRIIDAQKGATEARQVDNLFLELGDNVEVVNQLPEEVKGWPIIAP